MSILCLFCFYYILSSVLICIYGCLRLFSYVMCLFLIGPAPDPPVFVCRRATIDFVLLLLFIYFSSLLIYIVFVIIWLLAAFCCTLYASRVGPASSPLVFVCEGTGVYCPVVQGVRGMGILGHNQQSMHALQSMGPRRNNDNGRFWHIQPQPQIWRNGETAS